MKILMATGIFPPDTGGPATYCTKMATELMRRGHSVRVLTYSDATIVEPYLFPVHRVLRAGPVLWRYAKYFFSVLWLGRGADVLFVLDTLSAGYPVHLANKVLRKKVIVRVVGDHSWEQAQYTNVSQEPIDAFQHLSFYPGRLGRIRRLQGRVVRSAHRILTPSQALKTIIEGWHVPSGNIRVVYNAIEIPATVPGRTEARKKMILKKSDFLAVSVGRDVPWKGFGALKEAVAELNIDIKKVKLEIYSSAPREKVLTAMSAADVFVLNTAYEGFSHVILEALAFGTPIITTPAGGNREVITDGENGLFVAFDSKKEIKEALIRLYNDPVMRKTLSINAHETAKKYTIERMVNETEEVLKDLYN